MTSCACVCFQSGADEAGTGGIGALIDRMKRLNQTAEEMSQEELVKRFEKVGALNAERKFCVPRVCAFALVYHVRISKHFNKTANTICAKFITAC